METTQSQSSLDLERALRIIRRRGWIIVLCVVVAPVAAFGFSKAQTKQYTATAALLFKNGSVAQQASGVQASPQYDPQGVRDTNLSLVQLSNVVSQRTAAALGGGITAKQVKNSVSATAQGSGQSDVVLVAATWTSPTVAARIADAFSNQFVQQQNGYDQATIQGAIDLVRQQYVAMTRTERLTPQGQSLVDRMESLRVLKAMQNNTQLFQTATVPSAPSSPKVLRNTIVGVVVGLLLGFGCAFLRERLDRRLREPRDVEESLGMPMLGLIPHGEIGAVPGGAGAATAKLGLEPFYMLRAHLRYFNVDREVRTLLVTSALPSEGKTTIARSLAAAAAGAGAKTLLIEADLRRPMLSRTFGLPLSIGLAGALVARGPLEEAIQHVDVEGRMNGSAAGRLLDVMVAGASPPNPTELLESHAMEDLLAWARDRYELVVVDTAPLSVVADSIPLIKRVDGVIVVSRLGLSTRDASQRLRERLESLGAPVLGVVVNDARSRTGDYYGYGYGTKYATAAEQPPATTEAQPAVPETVAPVSAGAQPPES